MTTRTTFNTVPPPTEDPARPSPDAEPSLSARISNRMVQLQKEFFGKGPTKAKTYIVDDLIVVVLQGGFTAVEKTLLAEGRGDAVTQQRSTFQEVMQDRFTEAISELTDRTVAAYLSATHESRELSVETFLLER